MIASRESQYKILHFHHAGLDKLAEVFQQWKCCRETQLKDQVSANPSFFTRTPLFSSTCSTAPPTGHGGEVLHAVLYPAAHAAVGGDPPRGEAVSAAGRQHLAAPPQPERTGGGGVQASQGSRAAIGLRVIVKVLAPRLLFQFHLPRPIFPCDSLQASGFDASQHTEMTQWQLHRGRVNMKLCRQWRALYSPSVHLQAVAQKFLFDLSHLGPLQN